MKLRVKIPASYFIIMIFLGLLGLFLRSSSLGWLRFESIFFFLTTALIAWIFLIAFALIGAFFLGMLMSHRILSIGSFTPFETEMIRMQEDIKEILSILEKANNPSQREMNKTSRIDWPFQYVTIRPVALDI